MSRLYVLGTLFVLSIGIYIALIRTAAPVSDDQVMIPFLLTWLVSFLPYLAACAFVLVTKPLAGRWYWIELGMIFVGAFIFRVMLLPLLPGLSHDSWRYLWDARVILHGYSPYVSAPGDKIFLPLRDALIYGNSRFRNVPTIYPPGAQGVYVLSYLLAPSNLFVLKSFFVGFDLITCGVLALLLKQRGLDLRRVIIYAWCPLPIVEFAIQGHLDAVTVMLIMLAVLFVVAYENVDRSKATTRYLLGMQALIGFLIGLATLTKIYPLLLLFLVVRRRNWVLLVTCLATILIGYLPFLILGHGQAFGFFLTYTAEQTRNGGVIQQVIHWITFQQLHLKDMTTTLIEYSIDLVIISAMIIIIFIQRLHQRMSVEVATTVVITTIFAISSHIFPWYPTALLPSIAVLVGPLWNGRKISGKGLATATLWYFVCTCLLGYFFTRLDWGFYYIVVYDVVVGGLVGAALIGIGYYLQARRRAHRPLLRESSQSLLAEEEFHL